MPSSYKVKEVIQKYIPPYYLFVNASDIHHLNMPFYQHVIKQCSFFDIPLEKLELLSSELLSYVLSTNRADKVLRSSFFSRFDFLLFKHRNKPGDIIVIIEQMLTTSIRATESPEGIVYYHLDRNLFNNLKSDMHLRELRPYITAEEYEYYYQHYIELIT